MQRNQILNICFCSLLQCYQLECTNWVEYDPNRHKNSIKSATGHWVPELNLQIVKELQARGTFSDSLIEWHIKPYGVKTTGFI